jgi:hypothetical protein
VMHMQHAQLPRTEHRDHPQSPSEQIIPMANS